MQSYYPKGNKTRVTVIGDCQSTAMSGEELRKAVQSGLDRAFKEDQQNLKKV